MDYLDSGVKLSRTPVTKLWAVASTRAKNLLAFGGGVHKVGESKIQQITPSRATKNLAMAISFPQG